ncbi:hypothetical protein T4D_12729 [Trichinella pseudospiralis]|uniref:Uncharacterized protein n=1 Tax=Trichinella pseudospiralis TaxID=6337 RepID=A0A0V1FTG1_TRIPS|nr:hypothetical protein T4D_12729 [Trichinella pseudospiralis]
MHDKVVSSGSINDGGDFFKKNFAQPVNHAPKMNASIEMQNSEGDWLAWIAKLQPSVLQVCTQPLK